VSAFRPRAYARWQTTIDRRQFLGGAAAVAAALRARPLWAAASASGAIPDSVTAVGISGKPVTLSAADIRDLRSSLHGELLLAHDGDYDLARRVWNGAFDRHPALIARCSGTPDVVQAVHFARSHGLLTAVRAGGHSISGQSTCDGGLMIDVSPMKGIRVDTAGHTAEVQAGVLLGELDLKNQAAGLVTTLGTAADTGIAGLTLGGGQGRLMRKLGLACDNVRAFDIVTANGQLLHVTAQDNPDLFWALRGGGGNFGVVTNFQYQLHPLSHPVLAGGRLYPSSQAHSVLGAVAEMSQNAPDELYITGAITNVPPGSPIPAGRYVAIEAVYSGMPAEGERVLAPLARLGKPVTDTIGAKRYVDAQKGPTGASPPALPPGLGVYVKSGFLSSFPDRLIGEMVHAFDNGPEWLDEIGFGPLAGAVARVKPDATAYWNRQAQYELILDGAWSDHSQDAHNAAVLRDLWKAFEPLTRGYYVNTEPSADEQRLRATYGDNYSRLVQLKNKYDPTNLFRLNANIKPTAPAA
jgi:FAD/FMN-containing dehydrogenase